MKNTIAVRLGDVRYVPEAVDFCDTVAETVVDASPQGLLFLAAAVPGREAEIIFGDERDTIVYVVRTEPAERSVLFSVYPQAGLLS